MPQNPYETPSYVADYLLMHYGQPKDLCPFDIVTSKALEFHSQILKECVLPLRFKGPTRALDLGCGVGRFTMELSRIADHVLGIDNSKAFIEAAQQITLSHGLTVSIKESGTHYRSVELRLPADLPQGKVEFQVGDAMDLAVFPERSFHLVAAINLMCRLPSPRKFLSQLHRLVAPEGQLLLASPFSWLEAFTPPDQWLNSQDLEDLLRPHFRRVKSLDLPFVIREHRRKYQLVVPEVSVFVREG